MSKLRELQNEEKRLADEQSRQAEKRNAQQRRRLDSLTRKESN